MQLVYYVEDKSIKYDKKICNKTMLFCITYCFSAKEQNILYYILSPTVKWNWKSNSLSLSYSPYSNFALKSCLRHFILKSFAPDSIDLFLHSILNIKRIGLTLCHPWWSRLYPWNGRPWPLCCTGRSSGAVPWCLQQSRHGPTYWNKSIRYIYELDLEYKFDKL